MQGGCGERPYPGLSYWHPLCCCYILLCQCMQQKGEKSPESLPRWLRDRSIRSLVSEGFWLSRVDWAESSSLSGLISTTKSFIMVGLVSHYHIFNIFTMRPIIKNDCDAVSSDRVGAGKGVCRKVTLFKQHVTHNPFVSWIFIYYHQPTQKKSGASFLVTTFSWTLF